MHRAATQVQFKNGVQAAYLGAWGASRSAVSLLSLGSLRSLGACRAGLLALLVLAVVTVLGVVVLALTLVALAATAAAWGSQVQCSAEQHTYNKTAACLSALQRVCWHVAYWDSTGMCAWGQHWASTTSYSPLNRSLIAVPADGAHTPAVHCASCCKGKHTGYC